MKILMLHNYYQNSGGEDVSMAAEMEILQQSGHTVDLLKWHNDVIESMSALEKLAFFFRVIWNSASQYQVYEALKALSADLLHVQNFFPLVSPSVYSSARRLNVPVVQHLRNFRLGCLNSYLYRNGQVCEACVGRNPWRGVMWRCYRDSLPASLSLWQMLTVHRLKRTWYNDVDAFITPSQFAADKLIQIGLPPEKMHVKPNFVSDPLGNGQVPAPPAVPTFIFIGRLSPEKGVLELLQAWQQVHQPEWRLWIVGTGPQQFVLEEFCQQHQFKNVSFWGYCSRQETLRLLQQSSMLVLPCRWYETFGRVVIEAFACGRPALVSDIGAVAELVQPGETGFHVPYMDQFAWVERIRWCGTNLALIEQLGQQARQRYMEHYTPALNYQQLVAIYHKVLK